jgi:hypothetical protein
VQTRSPLKDRPLRVAGQSVDEQIHALISEDASAFIAGAAFAVAMAVLVWVRWFHPFTNPLAVTVGAAGVVAWACWKVRRVRQSIKDLKLGRDGERAVAEVLDGLRELGYRVFHDIVAPSFNLDHVLVGPKGILLIETKTRSKPVGRGARVEYDGRGVRIGGFKPDRDPVQQAEASARWLAGLLEQMTGWPCFVRPVVLYPGWYVDDTARKNRDQTLVWVLNPGNLAGFIHREPVRFSSEEVSAVAFHLARYVRTPLAVPAMEARGP